jgi:hypothetical protein
MVAGSGVVIRVSTIGFLHTILTVGGAAVTLCSTARFSAGLLQPFHKPDTVIGIYKLMEQIGEGGFGLVYVADQRQPVRRRVALKVIKRPVPCVDPRLWAAVEARARPIGNLCMCA